jgi:hypothetical protein
MNIFKKLSKGKERRRRGNKRERKRKGDEVGVMCFREVLLLVFITKFYRQEQLYNVDPPLASMAYKTCLVGRLAGSSLLDIALGRQAIEIDDVRWLPGGTIKWP